MSSSRYWELTVGVPADLSEGLTNLVWELGALGVVEEEPPGQAPRLRAFFPATASAGALERSVRDYLDGLRELGFAPPRELSVVALADQNWHEAWHAHFAARAVGRRLLVAPPWDVPAAGGRVIVLIEPGRAFGTGHHGSTVGCLEALEALVDGGGARRMIDLGTGSGILAIAAARLGAEEVLAVDDDPDAVAAALANASRNHVSDRVRCLLADARRLDEATAPLVVANLLTAAHRNLAPHYRRAVLPGGTLVLGGILDGEAPEVVSALGGHAFALRRARSVEGWTTLELRAPVHDRA